MSCKKFITVGKLSFIPYGGIKIKELTRFKGNYRCTGSHKIENDTVISDFEIDSKYSLVVIKLKNVSRDYKLNYYPNSYSNIPGWFSSIETEVYAINFTTSVFKNDLKINNIDFISDNEISCQINNDTIKSFNLSFSKFAVKINNQDKGIYNSSIEYYGLEKLSANFLFYKIEDEIYLFIMTPLKGKGTLENDTLYNYLFPRTNEN